MQINIVDAPMGTGKTTAVLRQVRDTPNERYIFATPYLTEVQRAVEACNMRKTVALPCKSASLKRLLAKGESVAITHSLYRLMDDEALALAHDGGYTLIIDETIELVDETYIDPVDWDMLRQRFVDCDDTGRCTMRPDAPAYRGALSETLKSILESDSTFYTGGKALFHLDTPKRFTSFDNIYILTYMFDSSRMAATLRLYGFDWRNLYVTPQHDLTTEPQHYDTSFYRELIHIWDNPRHNEIGNEKTAFSHGWCLRNIDKVKKAQTKTYALMRGLGKKNKDTLWTTFVDVANQTPNPYLTQRNFIPLGTRATNEYRDRSVVAYLCNRFMNPFLTRWYKDNGVPINEDDFALSEMLQFLFRSCIRDGNPVWLYIPSKRMRDLLEGWLQQ